MTEAEKQSTRNPQMFGMYVSMAVFLICAISRKGASEFNSPLVWFFMFAAATALFRAVSTGWQWVQDRRNG